LWWQSQEFAAQLQPAVSVKVFLRHYVPHIYWNVIVPEQLPASPILLLKYTYIWIGNRLYFNPYTNKLFVVEARIIIMILWPLN
jgi:hypothetical protein